MSGSSLKYHFMNTLEKAVNSDGKLLLTAVLAAAGSGAYLIPDAVNDYNTAMDNQGIEVVEQAVYDQLSQQIVDFQNNAQELSVLDEKLDYYDDLSRNERTPAIIDQEAALQAEFTDLKNAMSTQVKEISITAFTSGNTEEGIAIGEESLEGLWGQLQHTEPSLTTLQQTYDIETFPSPGFAFLDEARAGTEINENAPMNVKFNAAKDIASSSGGSSAWNGISVFLMMVLAAGGTALGGAIINGNRRRQFGAYGTRPKPEKPRAH